VCVCFAPGTYFLSWGSSRGSTRVDLRSQAEAGRAVGGGDPRRGGWPWRHLFRLWGNDKEGKEAGIGGVREPRRGGGQQLGGGWVGRGEWRG
jgi:hypothetical protein